MTRRSANEGTERATSQQVLPGPARAWIARTFTIVEDVVYVGLGLLLAASAIALLIAGGVSFVKDVAAAPFSSSVIGLLDHILLILLVVELLYTVQVSFREH